MSRYALSWEAAQDLQDIRAYYTAQAGTRVSRTLLGEMTRTFRLLADNPGIGHRRADLTGEPIKFWQVFSCLIAYDPAMRPLGIARVLHASRDLRTIFEEKPPRV